MLKTKNSSEGGFPTLTVVFNDREMDIFFTHPEKITMSLLTRMQQLIRRKLKEYQARAYAEMVRDMREALRSCPSHMKPMAINERGELLKPKDVSTIETPATGEASDDGLDALIEMGNEEKHDG